MMEESAWGVQDLRLIVIADSGTVSAIDPDGKQVDSNVINGQLRALIVL